MRWCGRIGVGTCERVPFSCGDAGIERTGQMERRTAAIASGEEALAREVARVSHAVSSMPCDGGWVRASASALSMCALRNKAACIYCSRSGRRHPHPIRIDDFAAVVFFGVVRSCNNNSSGLLLALLSTTKTSLLRINRPFQQKLIEGQLKLRLDT